MMTFFAALMICLVNFMRLLTCWMAVWWKIPSRSVKSNLKLIEANWMTYTDVRALWSWLFHPSVVVFHSYAGSLFCGLQKCLLPESWLEPVRLVLLQYTANQNGIWKSKHRHKKRNVSERLLTRDTNLTMALLNWQYLRS